jgi:hypothetical protein
MACEDVTEVHYPDAIDYTSCAVHECVTHRLLVRSRSACGAAAGHSWLTYLML